MLWNSYILIYYFKPQLFNIRLFILNVIKGSDSLLNLYLSIWRSNNKLKDSVFSSLNKLF